MELTGKCKEDFDKWMLIDDKVIIKLSDIGYNYTLTKSEIFRLLTDSMKYGVYLDYFDSVGLLMEMENRYESIDLANEIRNLQLK